MNIEQEHEYEHEKSKESGIEVRRSMSAGYALESLRFFHSLSRPWGATDFRAGSRAPAHVDREKERKAI